MFSLTPKVVQFLSAQGVIECTVFVLSAGAHTALVRDGS
jgi:hypothetical protein